MATYLEHYPESLTKGHGLISEVLFMFDSPDLPLFPERALDVERLYAIRSGFKTLTNSFSVLDEDTRARVILSMFSEKWLRIIKDYSLNYNTLDAYSITEEGSKSNNRNSSDTVKFGHNVNETGSNTGTVQTDNTDNNNNSESVYGFNSVLSVPSNSGTESVVSESTENRDLANSRNVINSGQDEKTLTEDESESHTFTRKGNIGYTTPQELIRQNIELWKTPFLNIMFSDIDEIMTVHVY